MTSLQIKYFLKVAECMSFSRAAEELFVAQPSVSRQIQLLEKEIGYELFDRTQRKCIHLTEAGMVFRNSFQRYQDDYRQTQAKASSLGKSSPLRLRVGIGADWNLTEMLLFFRNQVYQSSPQAQISFQNLPFLQMHNQLESGELDVIFCTKTSVQTFMQRNVLDIGKLHSRAYVRRGLLCSENEELSLEDFEGQTLLMLPEEEAPMAMQIVQLQFIAHRVSINSCRMQNRESIHQALLMGDGFAVYDEYVWLANDPDLIWLGLEESIPICMVWKDQNQNPLIEFLGKTAIEWWGKTIRQ